MPRKQSRNKKIAPEHSFLTIPVDAYQASTIADPNTHILGTPRYVDDEEPAILFHTRLALTGTCTDPPARAGEPYTISLYGDAFPTGDLALKVKDLQQRDKAGNPIYRRYLGCQYPRYDVPPSLGLVEKVWGGRLYLAVHEKKEGHTRWVRALSLQTHDPVEE